MIQVQSIDGLLLREMVLAGAAFGMLWNVRRPNPPWNGRGAGPHSSKMSVKVHRLMHAIFSVLRSCSRMNGAAK